MKKLITTITFFVAFLSFSFVSSAQTPADSANVTFQVDMNGVSSSFTTPEVNGSFNNWCGNCWAMSDNDSDNIWQVTGKVLKNTAYIMLLFCYQIKLNIFSYNKIKKNVYNNN